MSGRLIDPDFFRCKVCLFGDLGGHCGRMHFLTFLNLSGYESGKILSWFEAATKLAQHLERGGELRLSRSCNL
jgi:hypothetical protein